jgi:hypothetical protein
VLTFGPDVTPAGTVTPVSDAQRRKFSTFV